MIIPEDGVVVLTLHSQVLAFIVMETQENPNIREKLKEIKRTKKASDSSRIQAASDSEWNNKYQKSIDSSKIQAASDSP